MGAKTWMLVGSEGPAAELLARLPALDRAASLALAQKMFPGERLSELEDGNLCFANPDKDELYVSCFDGVAVVAAREFALDYPSQLPPAFVQAMPYKTVVLHAMHSVVGWFAFAIWQNGKLLRALSLSPDSGVLEDIGERLPFEQPYWAGEHPADCSFHFHPLEMAESALSALFGYVIEGEPDQGRFDAEVLPLVKLRRRKARRWFFWKM